MTVYAISGTILIFRDTDFLKKEVQLNETLPLDTKVQALGGILHIRGLKISKTEGDLVYFQQGTSNTKTGEASYSKKELPFVVNKMIDLHKATSSKPLFFLNVFFGSSLLFFVISSFWMFIPSTDIFRKGVYFSLGGLIFALLIIFM